jgi:GT2 family glycosyltransferase
MKRTAILIACFNRRLMTLRILDALTRSFPLIADTQFKIFLLDDSSSDGTAAAVREKFPSVRVVEGTGSLYWNRGMCAAYSAAKTEGNWDTYVLLNDDLDMQPQSFARVYDCYTRENAAKSTIMVGSVVTPEGELLYGGFRRKSRYHRLSIVTPDPCHPTEIDTMNGNCVIVPGEVFDALNGLDPNFHHYYGDTDLGYSAKKIGCRILLSPGTVGSTVRNPSHVTKLKQKSFKNQLSHFFASPNGIGQYARLMRKHSPSLIWPVLVVREIMIRFYFIFQTQFK